MKRIEFILLILILLKFDSFSCQQIVDTLNGNLLQSGDIILSQIIPKQKIEYKYEQPITEKYYSILLTLKQVVYSKECEKNYEFSMDIIEQKQEMFVLQIDKYQCLDNVEIQWFAYSYQDENEKIAYLKQQKYNKNIDVIKDKELSQDYLFDSSSTQRTVISLITGFSIPPHMKIEQKVNLNAPHPKWKYAINYNTVLSVQLLNQAINSNKKKLSVDFNFIISHPQIFSCQEKLDIMTKVQSNKFALQNIQFLDTTQQKDQGQKKVCTFEQYQNNNSQSYKPILNTKKKQISNNPLTDADFQENIHENNENEDEVDNSESENTIANQNIIKYTLILLGSILIIAVVVKWCKQYIQKRQEHKVPHIALNDL